MEKTKVLGSSGWGMLGRRVKHLFVRRQYKDALFKRIFRDKETLLELYNAINHTHYTDTSALEVYTIEDTIYLGHRNDLSFIVCGTLNLYEHQSSINPNMPLRGLIYFASQYHAYIEQHELNIYGSAQVKVPLPQYIIFYNGQEEWMGGQDVFQLSLKDAFQMPDARTVEPCLECRATVYNINYGHNKELMKQCRMLEEYSIFVEKMVQYLKQKMSIERAVARTMDECIEEGVLRDFLVKHRAEVTGMFAETLHERKIQKMMLRDARNEAQAAGLAIGRAEGHAEGLAEGRSKGLAEGLAEGRSKGLAEGLAEGRSEGLAEGLAEGRSKGLAEGLAEGRSEGLVEGRMQEKRAIAQSLYEMNLPLEQISQAVKEPIDTIQSWLDQSAD